MLGLLWFEDWSVQSVALGNALLAWVAGMVHSWAAAHTSGWLRRMFVAIAALAFFYSLAYWWLFWNPDRGGDWSDFLRPFGLITWIVAWAVEPVVLVRYLVNRASELKLKGERAILDAKYEAGMADDV